MPLDYPRSFNMTSAHMTTDSESWDISGELTTGEEKARRPSFKKIDRRSSQASRDSYNSLSDTSYHSAPARSEFSATLPDYGYNEGDSGMGGTSLMERRRPLSIAVPNAQGASSARRTSYRRKTVKIKSFGSSPRGGEEDQSSSSLGSGLLGFARRSNRRQNLSVRVGSGPLGTFENAIESLRTQNSNSEWQNVAAAVIVAAESSQAAKNNKSQYIKFMVNDKVLVFLTLLNVTNMEDPKDTFTVAPVNKCGFPVGEGRTDIEKTGPYTFVLATVKHVHFDEDDRYYTVVRADTGTDQRADSGKQTDRWANFVYLYNIY
jgi:hypothetical protein